MQAHDYAAQKAAQSGSSFYYSFLFLPVKERKAMIALYALCRELDDAVDAHEPDVARAKLAWWHGELLRLFSTCPEHPVSKALLPAIKDFKMPKRYFDELMLGMQHDLSFTPFENFQSLEGYCYRVAGVVGILSCHIFDMTDADSLKFAEYLGLALQLVNIIRDVGEDLRRGRNYLPLDWVATEQLNVDTLLQKKQNPISLIHILERMSLKARESYQKALEALPKNKRHKARSAIIMAEIYFALLTEIEKAQFSVLHQRIALTPIRKLIIAWKTHRREKKICAMTSR